MRRHSLAMLSPDATQRYNAANLPPYDTQRRDADPWLFITQRYNNLNFIPMKFLLPRRHYFAHKSQRRDANPLQTQYPATQRHQSFCHMTHSDQTPSRSHTLSSATTLTPTTATPRDATLTSRATSSRVQSPSNLPPIDPAM
jgi:hypothetical protein